MKSNKRVQFACELTLKRIPIGNIMPLHPVSAAMQKTVKYRRIKASIQKLGIIEPLVVHPQKDSEKDFYILLDGHTRLEILKQSEKRAVECLVALDDEAFTFNHKINRLSVIQEHFMIMKAIKNGVSEGTIAETLNVNISKIREKKNLLVGICDEAVELLRGKSPNAKVFPQLRKALPMRQIYMVEMMCTSDNFSLEYAKCLVAATPQDQLIESEKEKKVGRLSHAAMARMEREMESISEDFQQIEESHGKNVLNLVIVVGYLKKLLDNARIVKFLASNYSELLTEFQKTVEIKSLTDGSPT